MRLLRHRRYPRRARGASLRLLSCHVGARPYRLNNFLDPCPCPSSEQRAWLRGIRFARTTSHPPRNERRRWHTTTGTTTMAHDDGTTSSSLVGVLIAHWAAIRRGRAVVMRMHPLRSTAWRTRAHGARHNAVQRRSRGTMRVRVPRARLPFGTRTAFGTCTPCARACARPNR
jgi:hypothetical protein